MNPAIPDHLDTAERNRVAAFMSVVPGLGHLYKHHYKFGLGILLLGTPLVLWASVLLCLATLGISLLLLPIAFWGLIAADAFAIEDWHPDARKNPAMAE